MRSKLPQKHRAVMAALLVFQSSAVFGARIPPKPSPQPQPSPAPLPPPQPDKSQQMEFAITPFANMEHGWHIFEPGYRAVCSDSQGVVATAKLSIDAAVNGETTDGKGAYQALIIRPVAQYVRSGATSGQCELNICLDSNAEKPDAQAACQSVASVTDADPERALSFRQTVPYSVQNGTVSLQTGAPGLSAWHPAFSFAAPTKAFKDFQSPLVLDFSTDSKLRLLDVEKTGEPVRFDLSMDGKRSPTGWIGESSAFLAMDRNRNGVIDNGSELFGEMTGASVNQSINQSKTFKSGFEALAKLDSNQDGVIDGRDRDFGMLRLWFDRDANGETDAGELVSLSAAKVKAIGLAHKSTVKKNGQYDLNAGNEARLVGTFTMTDGSARQIADVWFRQKRHMDQATAHTRWLIADPNH